MYLQGTFIGKKSKLTISTNSKKEEVEKFLKDNPELKSLITDKEKVANQYKLMGLELPVAKKKKVATK